MKKDMQDTSEAIEMRYILGVSDMASEGENKSAFACYAAQNNLYRDFVNQANDCLGW